MANKPLTPKRLTILGKTKHGKQWHEIVAVSVGVHRTTVLKWASGTHKMSHMAQAALLKHFGVTS